jgi:multiple sugar transport system substrate-binding protein
LKKEQNMKKTLCLTVLCVTAAAMVFAGGGSQPSGTGAAGRGKTELTLQLGSWWMDKAPGIERDFEAAYPQYDLKIDCLPINGYFDNAASAILAGSPPDILDIDVSQVSSFADKNLLEDITQSVGSKLNPADFLKAAWDKSHYQGKMYGMPNRGTGDLIFYNKSMFDAAGVSYPADGWTYPQLLEMAQKLTVPGRQYGFSIAADASDPMNIFSSFGSVLWAFGGDFLSPDSKTCILDSPQSVAAITFWTELYNTRKVVPEGSLGYTISRDAVPLFEQGKVAMLIFGASGLETFEKNSNLKWGFVQPPSGATMGGGWTFTVPVTAKNKQGAYDFVLWYAKPEVQSKHNVIEPAVIRAWELGPPWNQPNYLALRKSAGNARPLPSVGVWSDMQTIIITELHNVLQQKKTPQQGGGDMARQINAMLN